MHALEDLTFLASLMLISITPRSAALALASSPIQPANAQEEGNAANLGVMEICCLDLFSGGKD